MTQLKAQPFVYLVKVPRQKRRNPYLDSQPEYIDSRVKLSLSGGNLMVTTGGGFKLFIDWLADKGLLRES